MRNLKLLFFALLMLPMALQAQEKLNLAGVYEANVKDVISSKMMYAVLDFDNCAAKDFTQLFTEKTAQFKQLPEDFMNAKKLKKSFAGTTAAGFVKFREKTLFALTEEMKLTNPRMEQGMIVADWQNTAGAKGTCGIIVKDDNSIEFVGLTSLERSLSPDGLTATCVEDRCLADQPRAKGTPEGVAYFVQEYEKGFIRATVTSCDPEIKVEFKGAEQMGQLVHVNLLITNMSPTLEFKMEMNATESMATDKAGNVFNDVLFSFGNIDGKKVNCFMPKGTPVKCDMMFILASDKPINVFNKVVINTYALSATFTSNRIVLDNVPLEYAYVEHVERPKLSIEIPAKVIIATKDNVNLRRTGSATGALAGKARIGTAFAYTGEEGTWYVGTSAETGEKVYIAKTLARVVETGGNVNVSGEYFYLVDASKNKGTEIAETYYFYNDPDGDPAMVKANYSYRTTTLTGGGRTIENYYKGTLKGWYAILDEELDAEGNFVKKLSTPIYVYPDPSSANYYINGTKFEELGME